MPALSGTLENSYGAQNGCCESVVNADLCKAAEA